MGHHQETNRFGLTGSNIAGVRPWHMHVMLGLLLLGVLFTPHSRADTPSAALNGATPHIAFYYGDDVPVDMLSVFQWVVVEADHVDAQQRAALQAHGAQVFAYVSLGEEEPWRTGSPQCGHRCASLGLNPGWNTAVMDLTDSNWASHIIEHRIGPLWARGYRSFFLDTLDSYKRYTDDDADRQAQAHALAALIKHIHATYPGIKLLLNRGFDVLPRIHDMVVGVVAESLFRQWNPVDKTYGEVDAKDRQWLLGKLHEVRDKWHLPVAVVDYVPPDQRRAARRDARRIADLGFTPWVANASLDMMGVGRLEVMPRRMLMLYQPEDDQDIVNDAINMQLAMPLEYLGYVPEYRSLKQPLPDGVLRGRYAGIVLSLQEQPEHPNVLRDWLGKQLDHGVPMALMGDAGEILDNRLQNRLGLQSIDYAEPGKLHIVSHTDMIGFETLPEEELPGTSGFMPVDTGNTTTTAALLLGDAQGHRVAPVLTGDWGGIALSPWLVELAPDIARPADGRENFFGRQSRWILDPFEFFRKALHLQPMPVPDPTTENGNRIVTAHIDGDGFASRAYMPGRPFASEVVRDEILKRFDLPTTVSVITGTMSRTGLFPELAPELQSIARDIFALPSVEVASHTYSHPFDWQAIHEGMPSGRHNLDIPGYHYSTKREIDGSVNFINTTLAPPGKKVEVVLWSGDAIPPEAAVARADQLGLANMNGGNTNIINKYNSLTNVSPMTRPAGNQTQVYAPIINEEVYTNGFKGPYWGFERVIQSFKLTDEPRRLKPMTIYYHFFSGTRQSAVNAVAKAYAHALSVPNMPMYESAYYRVVKNFRTIQVARTLDDDWLVYGATDDRTLRLPDDSWPQLHGSTGIAGVRDLPQGRYLALSGADRVRFRLRSKPPTRPYLHSANGRITALSRDDTRLTLTLEAARPLKATFKAVKGCRISAPNARIQRLNPQQVRLDYPDHRTGHVTFACP